MLSDLLIAPSIETLAEKYAGANICLVAQGPTAHRRFEGYFNEEEASDEKWHIWSQNGGWMSHSYSSLGFIMDDLKGHVWDGLNKYSREDVENTVLAAKCPLIASVAYDEFPMLVEFPLEWAIDSLPQVNKSLNLNETINYMLALAILFQVKRVDIFGADYHDENGQSFRPDKRACVEFWIGMAAMAGIEIRTCDQSRVMHYGVHNNEVELEGLYGYVPGRLPDSVMDKIEIVSPGVARIKVGGIKDGAESQGSNPHV